MDRPRLHRKFADADHETANAIHQAIEGGRQYAVDAEDQPICFRDNFSAVSVLLPAIFAYPEGLQLLILTALIDQDMQEDLKSRRLLNWCSKLQQLLPILTPNNGNCLLHAVSIAVWGVPDDFNTLRRLLNAEMARDFQRKSVYFARWSTHRRQQNCATFGNSLQNSEDLQREWQDVMQTASPQPTSNAAVPHAFLEPIHIYVVANILRRPIIVIADSCARSLSGASLQESDMGGIYLPLEWHASKCHRTPVVLAYNLNHFCPLLGQEKLGQPRNAPLLAVPIQLADLTPLPIKFAMGSEERNISAMLKRYLSLKEVPFPTSGSISTVLVATMEGTPPAPPLDVVKPYFDNCERKFQAYNVSHAANTAATESGALQQQGQSSCPGVAPVASPLIQTQSKQQTPPTVAHPSNEAFYNAEEETRVTAAAVPSVLLEVAGLQAAGQQSGATGPQSLLFQGSKCSTPGCEYYASQATGMKCSKCLEKKTILEAQRSLQTLKLSSQPAGTAQPTAPAPSFQLESNSSEMSMMPESCKNRCGFRSSRKTYPFCHECAERNWIQQQAPASAPPLPNAAPPLLNAIPPLTNAIPPLPNAVPPLPNAVPPAPVPSPLQALPGLSPNPLAEEELFGAGRLLPPTLQQLPVSPSTPSGGLGLGWPLDQCSTPGCSQQGSLQCSGQCIACYLQASHLGHTASPSASHSGSQTAHALALTGAVGGMAPLSGSVPLAFNTASPPTSRQVPSAVTTEWPAESKLISAGSHQASTQALQKSICSTPGCLGVRMKNEYDMCRQCFQKNASLSAMQPSAEPSGPRPSQQALTDISGQQQPPELQDLIESGSSATCGTKMVPVPAIAERPRKRKCAGPACAAMVYTPRQLCDTCTAVLQEHRAHRGNELPARQFSTPETQLPASAASRTGKCSTPGCTFFSAPQFGGLCSSCHKRRGALSSPVMRKNPIEVQAPPVRSATAPVGKGKLCIVEGCWRYGDPKFDHMCTKCWQHNHKQVMQVQANAIRHRPVQASLDARPLLQTYPPSAPSPSLSSPSLPHASLEEESLTFLDRLEDKSRLKGRCQQRTFACPNFANPQHRGLCNSCHRLRFQEFLGLEQHG